MRSYNRRRVVLSDRTIRSEIESGRIVIDPFDPGMIQPSSVDLRVDRRFRVFHNSRHPYIDVREPMEDLTEAVEVPEDRPFILHPGEFVLGQTLERVTLPNDLVARLEGKSSLGRLGLLIHSTAGFVDSGFSGNLTLELSNVANLPIMIYHGMPIGQISFMRMDGPVESPYGSRGNKYQGQTEPTASRFYLNFEREESSSGIPTSAAPAPLPWGIQAADGRNPMPNIGPLEIIILLVIVLVIFGPKRLPELGKGLGKGMREFKDSVTGKDDDDDKQQLTAAEAQQAPPPAPAATAAAPPPPPEADPKVVEPETARSGESRG